MLRELFAPLVEKWAVVHEHQGWDPVVSDHPVTALNPKANSPASRKSSAKPRSVSGARSRGLTFSTSAAWIGSNGRGSRIPYEDRKEGDELCRGFSSSVGLLPPESR